MKEVLQWIWELYEYISMCFFIPVAYGALHFAFGIDKQHKEILSLKYQVRELNKEIEKLKEEA